MLALFCPEPPPLSSPRFLPSLWAFGVTYYCCCFCHTSATRRHHRRLCLAVDCLGLPEVASGTVVNPSTLVALCCVSLCVVSPFLFVVIPGVWYLGAMSERDAKR